MRDLRSAIRERVADAGLAPEREIEVVEELLQHCEDRRAELRAGGTGDDAATEIVLKELDEGGALARELRRILAPSEPAPLLGSTRPGLVGGLLQDLRYALRSLVKSRGFTTVTLLSLALGIGANAAIFSLVDALRLRPLPVRHPEQLALIQIKDRHWMSGTATGANTDLTNPLWEQIRDHQEVFSGAGVWGDDMFNLAPSGPARWARGVFVSGGFFEVIGVPPFLGRTFAPADDRRGCGMPGAVVSFGFWQRELGGDAAAVGRTLTIDRHSVEIVGVTPPGFHGLDVGHTFDVALPICSESLLHERSYLDMRHGWWLGGVGRLKPGMTLERAASYLQTASIQWFQATIPSYNADGVEKYLAYRLTAQSAATGVSDLRETYSTALYLLLGTAALVLLIACANLANLLLARASAREREIAVRLALGASRGRLVRQLMTESLLLAVVGAALGLLLAQFLGSLVVSFLSTESDPTLVTLSPDWRVLSFTVGLAALTCVLFGLAPALRAARTDVGLVLKAAARGATAGKDKLSLRRVLVAGQVALSFVLLVGALLFSRSLVNLATVDPGFRTGGLLVASIDLRPLGLPPTRRAPIVAELLERLRATPLIDAASQSHIIPLAGYVWNESLWGRNPADKKVINFDSVSSGYFNTLQIPILAGRDLTADDDAPGAPLAVVVSQRFAAAMTDGASPIGETFTIEGDAQTPNRVFQVVGVVGDTKYRKLNETPGAIVYVPAARDLEPRAAPNFLIRSRAPLVEVSEALRRVVAEIAPEASIDLDVMDRMIGETLIRDRLMAALSGFFGILAVLLVTIGLYGVVSYAVARRTHEIGIRMALGARSREISRMVLGDALRVAGAGVLVGALLAIGAAQAARALLYGLSPHDPLTFVAAIIVLGAVAAFASLIPARRAARVDPMVALRDE